MARRILGLDIGESSLKAVLVEKGFKGGYGILDAAWIPVGGNGDRDQALKTLFERKNFKEAFCVAALPAKSLSLRQVRLPFKGSGKIKQTIAYELEPRVHYPISEAVADYLVAGGSGHSDVLAAAVPTSVVKDRIALLERQGGNLQVIDLESIPVVSGLFAQGIVAGFSILLDVGSRDSVCFFLREGKVFQVRRYSFGGDSITDAVATVQDIPFSEAEEKKKKNDTAAADAEISGVCGAFLSEVRRTLEFLAWNGDENGEISRVFLTGGGALHRGFQEEVRRAFGVPVELVDIARANGIPMRAALINTWQPLVMNQALSLATRSLKKDVHFNFRQGELEAKRGFGEIKKNIKWGAAVAAAIFLALAVDALLDFYFARQRLVQLKTEMTAVLKKYDPSVVRIVDPLQQLKMKVAENRKLSLGLSDPNSGTVLDMLKDISALAPESSDLLITSLAMDNETITMKGETKNFDMVEAIKRELGRSKYFQAVTIGSTNLVRQGNRVEFEMRIATKR